MSSPANLMLWDDSAQLAAPTPTIVVVRAKPQVVRVQGRQGSEYLEDVEAALGQLNEPSAVLFNSHGEIATLSPGTRGVEVRRLDRDALHVFLIGAIDWFSATSPTAQRVAEALRREVARDLAAEPPSSLPMLDALYRSPVLGPSGQLLITSGYHEADRLYLDLPRLSKPPRQPSREAVDEAARFLREDLLGDFPFATPADRTNALGLLVTMAVRPAIDGPVPAFGITATKQGSGKSLLTDAVHVLFLNERARFAPFPSEEGEIRRQITTLLAQRPRMAVFDNLPNGRRIDSPALASVITSPVWNDRVVGSSRGSALPNDGVWVLNGNNPIFSGELARRFVPIRLDPGVERPWERESFRHSNLIAWVASERGSLLYAVAVLVQNWIARGPAPGSLRLGSFESWAAIVSGVLEAAGVGNLLANREEFYESADDESDEWGEFFGEWHAKLGRKAVAVGRLCELSDETGLLPNTLTAPTPRGRATQLGNALKTRVGQIVGGYRLILAKDDPKHGRRYRLERDGDGAGEAAQGGDLGDLSGDLEGAGPQGESEYKTRGYESGGDLRGPSLPSREKEIGEGEKGREEGGCVGGGEEVPRSPKVPNPAETADGTGTSGVGTLMGTSEAPGEVPR